MKKRKSGRSEVSHREGKNGSRGGLSYGKSQNFQVRIQERDVNHDTG